MPGIPVESGLPGDGELERLKMENERIKIEMEKERLQA